MKKKRLRKYVIPTLITLSVMLIVSSSFVLYDYIDSNYNEMVIPVVNEEEDSTEELVINEPIIIKPYTSNNVSVSIPYYENEDTEENQQKSLIYYDNIYMPSTGILYTSKESFDIVSILDGTVKNITEDSIMGNVIEIEYSNKLTVLYQSVNDVKVTIGSSIHQGTVIASSGINKLTNEDENALYLEVYYNGNTINPEKLYQMSYEEVME